MSHTADISPSYVIAPICVEMDNNIGCLVGNKEKLALSPEILAATDHLRKTIQESTGVLIPGILFRKILHQEDKNFCILINDCEVEKGTLYLDKWIYCGKRDDLTKLQIIGVETQVSQSMTECWWIDAPNRERAYNNGLKLLAPIDFLLLIVQNVILDNLVEFIDHQFAISLIETFLKKLTTANDEDRLKTSLTTLIESPDALTTLTLILKLLVQEYIPVTNSDAILREFCSHYNEESNIFSLLETIRQIPGVITSLSQQIKECQYFQLSSDIETRIKTYIDYSYYYPRLKLNFDWYDYNAILVALDTKIFPIIAKKTVFLVSDNHIRRLFYEILFHNDRTAFVLDRQHFIAQLSGKVIETVEITTHKEDSACQK